jgi:hypothetical protein
MVMGMIKIKQPKMTGGVEETGDSRLRGNDGGNRGNNFRYPCRDAIYRVSKSRLKNDLSHPFKTATTIQTR